MEKLQFDYYYNSGELIMCIRIKIGLRLESWHLTIHFFCNTVLKTLLHVTLKRQAEISAYISPRLLRYFRSSCSKWTIMLNILDCHYSGKLNCSYIQL